MMDETYPMERMATPTFAVGRKDFNAIAYQRVPLYVIHGRKGLRVVPDTAQEIGENTVVFPNGPKSIVFRKKFTARRVERQVRYITADNSDRYDPFFTIYFKD